MRKIIFLSSLSLVLASVLIFSSFSPKNTIASENITEKSTCQCGEKKNCGCAAKEGACNCGSNGSTCALNGSCACRSALN